MAAATTRQQRLSVVGSRSTREAGGAYVYGNAVPEPVYDPAREREEEQRRQEAEREHQRKVRQQRARRQVAKNRRRALYMSPGYVLFLSMAAAVALFVCVNYVNLQSQITSSARNITVLQEELSNMREENNTRYNAVTNSVNMTEVAERAEELGMVYAAEDQIVEYNSPSSDYVIQYENIPEDGLLAQSDKRE